MRASRQQWRTLKALKWCTQTVCLPQVKKLEGTQRVLARGMQRAAVEAETPEEVSQQQLLLATKQKLKQRALDKKALLSRSLPLQASSRSPRSAEVLPLRAAQSKATNSQLGADRVAEERTPRIELVSYLSATIPTSQPALSSAHTPRAPHSPTPPATGPAPTTQQSATPTAFSTVPSTTAPLTPRVRLTLALQSEQQAAAQVQRQSRSAWDPRTQSHTIEIAQLWS